MDPSFGTNGVSTATRSFVVAVTALEVMTNGNIIVAGASQPVGNLDSGPSLLAFRSDGSLDPGFGQGGQVDPEPGFYGRYSAIAFQPDGKIVAIGDNATSTGAHTLVARFLPNGQPDSTFGVAGRVFDPVLVAGVAPFAYAVELQADGRILVAGAVSRTYNLVQAMVLRLNADGTLDTTFGTGGVALLQYAQGELEELDNASANAVLLQPDGKIILVGSVGQGFAQLHGAYFNRVGVARLNADGTPDAAFGGGGSTTIWKGFGAAGFDAVLRPDGRIIIGGEVEFSPPVPANDPFEPGQYANVVTPAVLQLEGGTSAFPSPLHQARVVEYYDASFDHYFMTALPFEIASLDTAGGQAWSRTGRIFKVITEAGADLQIVCRFFSGQSFAPKSSHFYTPYPLECAVVQQNPGWIYEGGVFFLALPEGTPGSRTCVNGDLPLYRLYNNGQGGAPNHRYTTDLTVYDQMVAQGWVPEGEAQTKVFACVPAQ